MVSEGVFMISPFACYFDSLMDRHPTDLTIIVVIYLLYLLRLKFEMFQLQRLVLNKISIEIQFKNDIKYKPLPRAI